MSSASYHASLGYNAKSVSNSTLLDEEAAAQRNQKMDDANPFGKYASAAPFPNNYAYPSTGTDASNFLYPGQELNDYQPQESISDLAHYLPQGPVGENVADISYFTTQQETFQDTGVTADFGYFSSSSDPASAAFKYQYDTASYKYPQATNSSDFLLDAYGKLDDITAGISTGPFYISPTSSLSGGGLANTMSLDAPATAPHSSSINFLCSASDAGEDLFGEAKKQPSTSTSSHKKKTAAPSTSSAEQRMTTTSGGNNLFKPTIPYAQMITQAIERRPDKKITLNEIYNYAMSEYDYFKTAGNGWKNSIRHNLSLNKLFVRVARPSHEKGKGAYWSLASCSLNGNGHSEPLIARKPASARSRAAKRKSGGRGSKKSADVDEDDEEEEYEAGTEDGGVRQTYFDPLASITAKQHVADGDLYKYQDALLDTAGNTMFAGGQDYLASQLHGNQQHSGFYFNNGQPGSVDVYPWSHASYTAGAGAYLGSSAQDYNSSATIGGGPGYISNTLSEQADMNLNYYAAQAVDQQFQQQNDVNVDHREWIHE